MNLEAHWYSIIEHGAGSTMAFHLVPPAADRQQMCDWLTQHGIDPNLVTVPGWVRRDVGAHQITWLGPVVLGDGTYRIDDGSFARTTHTVQLEAPPLSWPSLHAGAA